MTWQIHRVSIKLARQSRSRQVKYLLSWIGDWRKGTTKIERARCPEKGGHSWPWPMELFLFRSVSRGCVPVHRLVHVHRDRPCVNTCVAARVCVHTGAEGCVDGPPPPSSSDPPPPCGPIYFPEGLPLSPLSFLSRLRQPVSAQTWVRSRLSSSEFPRWMITREHLPCPAFTRRFSIGGNAIVRCNRVATSYSVRFRRNS